MAKKEKLFNTDYKFKFQLNELGRPTAVEVEGEPHEAEAVNSGLATIMAGAKSDGAFERPDTTGAAAVADSSTFAARDSRPNTPKLSLAIDALGSVTT